MKLKPATKDDYNIFFKLFAEVQNMHAQALPDFFRPAIKDRYIHAYFVDVIKHKNKHLIIGFDDGQPFGYILYVIGKTQQNSYRNEERFIYINQIAVTESYRGRGFGKALIDHVKQIAKNQKIRKIGLDVWLFNRHAIEFFERQGFSALNQVMWYDNG